jgi:hypothetical protein
MRSENNQDVYLGRISFRLQRKKSFNRTDIEYITKAYTQHKHHELRADNLWLEACNRFIRQPYVITYDNVLFHSVASTTGLFRSVP